ncbi:MAG: hypothetical protein M1829_003508 [Trizodia sp. TS-e1964]|nr:MAG: hypothetical protein M1829_003508 [Trizodia sp. TS-e1964]
MQTSSGAQPSIRPPTNYKNPYNTTGAAAQKAYGIEYVASTLAMVDAIKDDAILEAYQGRQWEEGDVYGPHDLSSVQISEWKKWRSPKADAFDYLGLDPEGEYKNFAILSEFVSDFGRIKHSSETGLRPVNQRKISRAIKRAIGIGIMPSVHRHPEIIHDDVSDLENRLLEHESGD